MHKVIADRNGGKQIPLTEKEKEERVKEEAKSKIEKEEKISKLAKLAEKKEEIRKKLNLTVEEFDVLLNS